MLEKRVIITGKPVVSSNNILQKAAYPVQQNNKNKFDHFVTKLNKGSLCVALLLFDKCIC